MKSWLKSLLPRLVLRVYHKRQLAQESRRNAGHSPEEVFSEIYRARKWGGEGLFCSGGGSALESIVGPYLSSVRAFLQSAAPVKPTVVDLGCGDFAVGSRLVADCAKYIGVDVVPDLVKHLQAAASPHVQFLCLDMVRDELPAGDICLVRQVLQHLSNDQIMKVLAKLSQYPTVFITEHYPQDDPGVVPNIDKIHGSGIRLFDNSGVYLDQPPFNVPANQLELVLEVPDHGFGDLYKPGVIRTFRVTFPRPT